MSLFNGRELFYSPHSLCPKVTPNDVFGILMIRLVHLSYKASMVVLFYQPFGRTAVARFYTEPPLDLCAPPLGERCANLAYAFLYAKMKPGEHRLVWNLGRWWYVVPLFDLYLLFYRNDVPWQLEQYCYSETL